MMFADVIVRAKKWLLDKIAAPDAGMTLFTFAPHQRRSIDIEESSAPCDSVQLPFGDADPRPMGTPAGIFSPSNIDET